MIRVEKRQAGFSLLELSVAMVIISLLMVSMMEAYREYARTKITNDTGMKRSAVEYALSRFIAIHGRMPCPANPKLSLNDIASGHENCMTSTIGLACDGGVCRVAGYRDASPEGPVGTNDTVLIGAVPYVTLGIKSTDTIDSWGGKLTYAVSEFVTLANSFNDNHGAIRKESFRESTGTYESDMNPLAGDNPDSYLYALVSHGPDRKGAFGYGGFVQRPCGFATDSADFENCNGDAVFRDGRKSLGDTNMFYDDGFLSVALIRDHDKWEYTATPGSIKSKSMKVGIGRTEPQAFVDVDGNMQVGKDTGAANMMSKTFCNKNGDNCFSPKLIGGEGDSCNGGVFEGIRHGKASCPISAKMSGLVTSSCPSGRVKGFNANGTVNCL